MEGHRAWIALNLEHLRHNVAALQALLPPGCRLMPVVKANAYGHGAVPIARALSRLGIRSFCVASPFSSRLPTRERQGVCSKLRSPANHKAAGARSPRAAVRRAGYRGLTGVRQRKPRFSPRRSSSGSLWAL